MIRPVLTEIALFALPFIVYGLFLLATRSGVVDPQSWSMPVLGWLTVIALLLVVGSFVVIAQFSGSPPGSTYVPAHVEDGKFVPAQIGDGKEPPETAK